MFKRSVIPAQAGTHIPETVVMDSRLRGNDDRASWKAEVTHA